MASWIRLRFGTVESATLALLNEASSNATRIPVLFHPASADGHPATVILHTDEGLRPNIVDSVNLDDFCSGTEFPWQYLSASAFVYCRSVADRIYELRLDESELISLMR